jgi:hypothetical protein
MHRDSLYSRFAKFEILSNDFGANVVGLGPDYISDFLLGWLYDLILLPHAPMMSIKSQKFRDYTGGHAMQFVYISIVNPMI